MSGETEYLEVLPKNRVDFPQFIDETSETFERPMDQGSGKILQQEMQKIFKNTTRNSNPSKGVKKRKTENSYDIGTGVGAMSLNTPFVYNESVKEIIISPYLAKNSTLHVGGNKSSIRLIPTTGSLLIHRDDTNPPKNIENQIIGYSNVSNASNVFVQGIENSVMGSNDPNEATSAIIGSKRCVIERPSSSTVCIMASSNLTVDKINDNRSLCFIGINGKSMQSHNPSKLEALGRLSSDTNGVVTDNIFAVGDVNIEGTLSVSGPVYASSIETKQSVEEISINGKYNGQDIILARPVSGSTATFTLDDGRDCGKILVLKLITDGKLIVRSNKERHGYIENPIMGNKHLTLCKQGECITLMYVRDVGIGERWIITSHYIPYRKQMMEMEENEKIEPNLLVKKQKIGLADPKLRISYASGLPVENNTQFTKRVKQTDPSTNTFFQKIADRAAI